MQQFDKDNVLFVPVVYIDMNTYECLITLNR